jgi:hypothetical protein
MGRSQKYNCDHKDGCCNHGDPEKDKPWDCPGGDCVNVLKEGGAQAWLSIGGGTGFTISKNVVEENNIASLGYDGISLDIESTTSTEADILGALEAAKAQGLTTHVTVAHTGFGIPRDTMMNIIKSKYTDVVSPQLYTGGLDIMDNASPGISWNDWKTALTESTVKVIPGVPSAEYPSKVDETCLQKWCNEALGRQCDGYISWEAEATAQHDSNAHWDTC